MVRPASALSGSAPAARTALARGLKRRCPRCGGGRLYHGWLRLRDECPQCGLVYLDNQGDGWGLLLLLDRALFIFPLIVMLYFRSYDPGSWVFWAGAAALALLFWATLPHRNGLGIAVDYLVRRRAAIAE